MVLIIDNELGNSQRSDGKGNLTITPRNIGFGTTYTSEGRSLNANQSYTGPESKKIDKFYFMYSGKFSGQNGWVKNTALIKIKFKTICSQKVLFCTITYI